mgnify:CR=1 FL=1
MPASCRLQVTSRRFASRGGPGIRDDSGTEAGADVPIFYDPLISKLVAWGDDRPQAIARMRRALREYDVIGIKTTVPFFRWMLEQPDFVDARFTRAISTTCCARAPASRSRRLTMSELMSRSSRRRSSV